MASSSSSSSSSSTAFYRGWNRVQIARVLTPGMIGSWLDPDRRGVLWEKFFVDGKYGAIEKKFAYPLMRLHPNTATQLHLAKELRAAMFTAYETNREQVLKYNEADEQSSMLMSRYMEEELSKFADKVEEGEIARILEQQLQTRKAMTSTNAIMDEIYSTMQTVLTKEFKARDSLIAAINKEKFDPFDLVNIVGIPLGRAIEQQQKINNLILHRRHGAGESKRNLWE